MSPGLYEMADKEYFADPWGAETPSLSASIAKTILGRSLQNAWVQSPHCPAHQPIRPNEAMEFGKAVHALVFGGEKVVVIDAPDFRTKDARAKRDEANAAGLIPLLKKRVEELETCAQLVKRRFDNLYDGPYIAEQVALWQLDGRDGEPTGPRRAKIDSRGDGIPVIVDLKTTKASISFDACQKRIFSDSLHIQAAAYIEALETLMPHWRGRVQFYFQWVEQSFPYAMSEPIFLDGTVIDLGREQWHFAGQLWDQAVAKNAFVDPYNGIARKALPPIWAVTQWEDTRARYQYMGESSNAA